MTDGMTGWGWDIRAVFPREVLSMSVVRRRCASARAPLVFAEAAGRRGCFSSGRGIRYGLLFGVKHGRRGLSARGLKSKYSRLVSQRR